MRLSDVKGPRTLDVIADLIEPVANIAQDEKAMELFQRKQLPEGMSAEGFVLERAKKAVPVLLKGHKEDLITIMAAIGGVPRREYEEGMNLASVIKDVVELVTDSEFMGFLASLVSQGESGSTSVTTEGQQGQGPS